MKLIVTLAQEVNDDSNFFCPLVKVAGKPLVGYLIDNIIKLKPDEVIFILGKQEKEIMKYINTNYTFKSSFIKQKIAKGSAHAIYGTKNHISEDCFILFGDTFFSSDFSFLKSNKSDAVLWVKEVPDPTNFGVVFLDGNKASKIIEKPPTPLSPLAMIGAYYFKDSKKLFDSIKFLLDNNIKTNGSFVLADAIQLMIDKKNIVTIKEALEWFDVSVNKNLFALTRKILAEKKNKKELKITTKNNCIINQPVFIAKNASVKNSVIGPNVSVGRGAKISDSIISDSIICEKSTVKDVILNKSIVGENSSVKSKINQIKLSKNTTATI